MTRTARRRFRIALYALCAMLLTQWTLAAHACPVARLSAAPAVPTAPAPLPAHAASHGSAQGCPDCVAEAQAEGHHASPGDVDASLCVKHCDDEGQAGGSAPMAAIDAPVETGLRVALPAPRCPFPSVSAPASGDATAPPLIILYCVSLS